MWDVKKAFEGSNLSAQEQLDMLEQISNGVKHMRSTLMENCRYCKGCEKHYFKKELKISSRDVTKTVCINPLTGGYLDPYEYEEQKVTEFCYVCPEEHEMTGYVEWLSDL